MALVRVRLFAALREIAGAQNAEAEGDTVGEVIDALAARYGERFEAIARAGSAVVDAERAEPSRPLTGGEEVALLPPVSGG
ncbi:MAG TPA: MoaD/ThiS family protein [Actinomycetota bacterium]|nr:MoaD/ThiS family protein [Actinomycetota bacterium]